MLLRWIQMFGPGPLTGRSVFCARETATYCPGVVRSGTERKVVIPVCRGFFAREAGQGLTEYVMILFLIAVVCVAVVALIAPRIEESFQSVADSLGN
jgi:Flp pilus assembly pilin Flp